MHAGPASALLLLLAAASSPLVAQGLSSPGPLATAHARLDNMERCLACHDAGRELSGRKCLVCHASLAALIRADRGYHAVATKHGAALACRSCHSEHNGRPFRLVKWPASGGREAFDHRQTGWTLEGAHAKPRCEACHRAPLVTEAAVRRDSSLSIERTYLGLPTTCTGCHLDEHRGRVSRRCEDCHGVDAWKPAPRFDHERTRFPLTGLHSNLRCEQCHAARRDLARGPGGSTDTSFVDFHATKTAWARGCIGCHPSPHRETGRVGSCERCHSTAGWFVLADSVKRFDHTAIGFPLRGAHAAARCESCHLPSARAALPDSVVLVRANFLRPLGKQRMGFARCDACHGDVHQGQLPAPPANRDCGACHTESRFSPAHFPLAAHDSTRFPLTGAHRATPCTACHPLLEGAAVGSGRIRFVAADLSCASCHRDPHGGQFLGRRVPGARAVAGAHRAAGTACDGCHDTDAWSPAVFDHDSTRYPLRGAHRPLACSKCHQRPASPSGLPVRFSGLPTTCDAAGCHRDPHAGQFRDRARGGACTTCHGEVAWKPVVFDHQKDADYALDGAHGNLRCAACHRPEGQPPVVRYRPLPHRCEDCHGSGPSGGRRS
jgi:hypothetical protein